MSTAVLASKQATKNNDSCSPKKKDKPNIPSVIPVLKKGNKAAHVFGPAYYHCVREAVFEIPHTPFLPQDIPESLKLPDSQPETFHVCLQCKDSFRFSNTLEEHKSRRSWILGYWCQYCFSPKCEHEPQTKPMCSSCLSDQFNRRAYLRAKGMKKGQRAAIIKIFYNQCAFFEHLKNHDVSSVEIGEVMLMPLPLDITKEDNEKLEKACKAIMEYGFLNRIHVMELLREQKAEGRWWDPPPVDANSNNCQVELNIPGIIHTFRERNFIDSPSKKNASSPNEKSTNKIPLPSNKNIPPVNFTISTSNLSNTTSNQSVSLTMPDSLSVKYFHSPYRPPADIAFVDCGPSHAVYKSQQLSSLSKSSQLSSPSNSSQNLSQSNTTQVLSLNSSQFLTPNSKQLSTPNSKQLLTQNSKQLLTPNSKQLSTSNSKQLLTPNSKQLSTPNTKQLLTPNSKQLSTSNTKQLLTPNSKQLSTPNSKQLLSQINSPESSREPDFFTRSRNASGQFIKKTSQPSQQSPMTSILTTTSSTSKVYTVSTCNANSNSGPKISVKKFASEPVSNWGQLSKNPENPNQAQPSNVNTKILTVHSEKCLDISSIISQLPADVMNSKKIVFIEQNSNQVQYQKNSPGNKNPLQISSGPTLSANCVKVVPQKNILAKEKEKKPIPILPSSCQPNAIVQTIYKNTTGQNLLNPRTKTYLKTNPKKPALNLSSPLEQKTVQRQTFIPIRKNPSTFELQPINPYDGKIFYQSGKRFLIKQTNKIKPSSVPASSVLKPNSQVANKVRHVHNLVEIPTSDNSKSKILTKPVSTIISNSISPLTPSTSPSESSSSSSCDSQPKSLGDKGEILSILAMKPYEHVKSRTDFDIRNLSEKEEQLLSIRVAPASKLFLHLSETLTLVRNKKCNLLKYKQNLLDTLPYLKRNDIQERIDHIKNVSKEFLKALKVSDDRIIDDHERLIALLTDSVEQAKILNIPQNTEEFNQNQKDLEKSKIQQESDKNLDPDNSCNWENESMRKCSHCLKMIKPDNYLSGFSKLSANESRYCKCYNCVCPTCDTYQGTLPRYLSHRNYHLRINPFVCPDCFKKFSTYYLLEKHLWLECFHPRVKNWFFACRVCGVDGLTTLESLANHFLIMHSKRGYVCPQCKEIFFSKSDCENHFSLEHNNNDAKQGENKEKKIDTTVSDIVEIIMCKIGNCVVLKKNYTKHLIDHVGVEQQVFYKCPFCSFSKRFDAFEKNLLRDHMLTNHNNLLTQVTTLKILNDVQQVLKEKANHEGLPMIINTRTIAQEAFEKGTQDEDTFDKSISNMPMIVDVRSEAVNLNPNNLMPKILEVKSIANDSLLKKSQGSESRKRKSNTVIEITLSPKKISSVEIKKNKVDVTDSNKSTNSSTSVKRISQVNETKFENRSLERRNSVVEIIDLENSAHDDKVINVEKEVIDVDIDDVNKDKECINEDNKDVNTVKADANKDNEDNTEKEQDINKVSKDKGEINKDNVDVYKNKNISNDKRDVNNDHPGINKNDVISDKEVINIDVNKDEQHTNTGNGDCNISKSVDNINNKDSNEESSKDDGDEDNSKDNEKCNIDNRDSKKDKEDNNKDNQVFKKDNEDVTKKKEDINKDVLNKHKECGSKEYQDFSERIEDVNKDSGYVGEKRQDVCMDIENVVNKENTDAAVETNVDKNKQDINEDNTDDNKNRGNCSKDDENISEGNHNISKADYDLKTDKEDSGMNNKYINKEKKNDDQVEGAYKDNENINKTNKNLKNHDNVTIKDNEIISIDNEVINVDNEVISVDNEVINKDNNDINKDDGLNKVGEDLNRDEKDSRKVNEENIKQRENLNTDNTVINKDIIKVIHNESFFIDNVAYNVATDQDTNVEITNKNKKFNNDNESSSKDNQVSSKIDQFSSKVYQETSKDESSAKDKSSQNEIEFLSSNIQCVDKNEFSNKNNSKDSGNEKNSQEIDNFQMKEQMLVVSEDNVKEEAVPLNNLNALENLKAKMSRTFKSLAKRMEATTTTLQQECSKSLPMLKNISQNVENGSKMSFNEVRSRRRKIRKSDNWHLISNSSRTDGFHHQNTSFQEKGSSDEKMRINHNICNLGENSSFGKNTQLDESKLEGNFILNEKSDITQPPPLSRIPQHILKCHSAEETQSSRRVKRRKQSRIAFNGPLNYDETVLDFKCHICSKLIDSSWPVLKAHFDIWHPNEYKVSALNPQLLKISSDYIDGGYKEMLSKKIKCESSPRKRKRKSRFTPKSPEKIALDKSAGLCVTTESVEEDDGMFKCRKCEMKFSDRDILRQHVSKSHRIRGRYLVCLECGDNFVVAPSLQMHLKAFHAIDDPLTYLLQNTSFAPENLEDTEEEEEEVTIEANQCYVCMAVFEDKNAVDKHLRVHGMAFLNQKRIEAKKNLNSPEKKLKITSQTEETRHINSGITLNPAKLQDDTQIKVNQVLATNSLETEVSVH